MSIQFYFAILALSLVFKLSCSEENKGFHGAKTTPVPTSFEAEPFGQLSGNVQELAQTVSQEVLTPFDIGIQAPYDKDYQAFELGRPEGLRDNMHLGAISIDINDPLKMLVPARQFRIVNSVYTYDQGSGLYSVPVTRNDFGQIVGFAGAAQKIVDFPLVDGNAKHLGDGGNSFGPNGNLYITAWPYGTVFELSLQNGNYAIVNQTTLISEGGNKGGAMAFVPDWIPTAAGKAKFISYHTLSNTTFGASHGRWYDVLMNGAMAVSGGNIDMNVNGTGADGFAYVPSGSAHFDRSSMVVMDYSRNSALVYEVNSNGDPILPTNPQNEVVFANQIPHALGAHFDKRSGDFAFTTKVYNENGGGIYLVRGFRGQQQHMVPSQVDVFIDSNKNGSFDVGEPKTTTTEQGGYEFKNLPVALHKVVVLDKEGKVLLQFDADLTKEADLSIEKNVVLE